MKHVPIFSRLIHEVGVRQAWTKAPLITMFHRLAIIYSPKKAFGRPLPYQTPPSRKAVSSGAVTCTNMEHSAKTYRGRKRDVALRLRLRLLSQNLRACSTSCRCMLQEHFFCCRPRRCLRSALSRCVVAECREKGVV
jgi:hypothetical protein